MLSYYMLYIFWFLHQTTTLCLSAWTASGCISFDSYIKPQLWRLQPSSRLRCISFDSYIKPQLTTYTGNKVIVVYLLIPTSNHNFNFFELIIYQLYIFWFLHQTTTLGLKLLNVQCCISFDSYIKPQLFIQFIFSVKSCISFDSYIKPQPGCPASGSCAVVYLLIPTSNHNSHEIRCNLQTVVYLLIPTSNHNQLHY